MSSDTELALEAARAAGDLLLAHRGPAGGDAGPGSDPTTTGPDPTTGPESTTGAESADVRADRLIAAILGRERPGDAILSEEVASVGDRAHAERVWIVDPLDGTREYGESGRRDWAVHVALWVAGELTEGVVALPAAGEVWSTAGLPADAVRRPIARVVVSRTRAPAWALAVAEEIGAEVVPMGSAGAKTAAVLRGDADAYLHDGGQYEWDSAAPVAVARHHGYHASRADGGDLRYNQPDTYLPDLVICPSGQAGDLLERIARHRSPVATGSA